MLRWPRAVNTTLKSNYSITVYLFLVLVLAGCVLCRARARVCVCVCVCVSLCVCVRAGVWLCAWLFGFLLLVFFVCFYFGVLRTWNCCSALLCVIALFLVPVAYCG